MLKKIKKKLIKSLNRRMEIYEITLNELKVKQKHGAEVIDVRSICEYNEGHILRAVNIPEYEIDLNFKNIYPDKNQEIVLYCKSGKRSKSAYKKINKMGYKNIYCLYGGIDNY